MTATIYQFRTNYDIFVDTMRKLAPTNEKFALIHSDWCAMNDTEKKKVEAALNKHPHWYKEEEDCIRFFCAY